MPLLPTGVAIAQIVSVSIAGFGVQRERKRPLLRRTQVAFLAS